MINDPPCAVSNGNLAHDRQDGHLMCPAPPRGAAKHDRCLN